MHICLDFLPELLAQPIIGDLAKQLFAVDLISHLCLQYALPKSFNVARLAVNTLSTLLSGETDLYYHIYLSITSCFSCPVLPSNGRTEIYLPALPALVRIATAFPPLVDDIVSFLVQLGRVCLSQSCLHGSYDHRIVSSLLRQLDHEMSVDEDKEEEETTLGKVTTPHPPIVSSKKTDCRGKKCVLYLKKSSRFVNVFFPSPFILFVCLHSSKLFLIVLSFPQQSPLNLST